MVKVKEIKLETIEEVLEMQSTLWEENENYTFRIIKMFLHGYCLEVYEPKREKLYSLLDGYYECFREEIKKLEKLNSKGGKNENGV